MSTPASSASGGHARLFVAVRPVPAAVAELDAAVRPLRAAHPELRWTASAGWHLTLAFLGNVDDTSRDALDRALAGTARGGRPLRLAFTGGGHFDDRALWAGVTGDVRALTVLARATSRACVRYGSAPREHRPYRAHVTLARAPGRGYERGTMAGVATRLEEFGGAAWTAGELRLVRSRTGPGGSAYEDEGVWPLGE